MIKIDKAESGKMKTTVINCLYLLLSTSLAFDCQCRNTTNVSSRKSVLLKVYPENPKLGDDVCFCCFTRAAIKLNFMKNNERVCPITTFRCYRIGNALKIENIKQEQSGNWTCGTRYDQSENISVQFKDDHTRLPEVDVSLFTRSTNKTTEMHTGISSFSPTETTAEKLESYSWIISICSSVASLISVAVIFFILCCLKKGKRQPYDNLVRRVRQRQNVSLHLDAEDLHDIGTSLGNRRTCENNSHSYSSLSSGNDESVVDIHEERSTVIAAVTLTTDATVHHVASPTGPHPKKISEASSLAWGSSSSTHLSDTDREILNVVYRSGLAVQTTLENEDIHQTPRTRVGERKISVNTNVSINGEDNFQFQPDDDHDEDSESNPSTTAHTGNGIACVYDRDT